MTSTNGSDTLYKNQQAHILKLITQSFCKELAKYGLDKKDILTVSIQLLDYVIDHPITPAPGAFSRSPAVQPASIDNRWEDRDELSCGEVFIRPLLPDQVPMVADWLTTTDVQHYFAELFPHLSEDLHRHFFEAADHRYCGIFFREVFVGIIGAENIDVDARKLEMKKFIGDPHYRGLGIGKTATFLWLYYVFEILDFNKVYIYSLDTNIRNINLNASLGFEMEGVLYQDVYFDGEYRDVVRMSLLESSWKAYIAREMA